MYVLQIATSNSLTQDSGGQLFALDNSTLFVRELVYDGLGPDAFFLAGDWFYVLFGHV